MLKVLKAINTSYYSELVSQKGFSMLEISSDIALMQMNLDGKPIALHSDIDR